MIGLAAVATVSGAAQGTRAGWTIPDDALTRSSPVPTSPTVVARGRQLYGEHCARCHGPRGRGDGRDGDPDRPPGDLTDPARAARNPDGVVFYKVLYGRRSPRMPAFGREGLSEPDVWAVVAYIQTLRRQP